MAQIQAKFFTDDERYSVANDLITLEGDLSTEKLNLLINSLLELHSDDERVDFEFFVNQEILHLSLKDHLEQSDISLENVIEIEYSVKCPAPEPVDSLLHEDWVSAVHSRKIGDRDLILSGCYDCTVNIWTATGKKLSTFSGHSSPVKSVKWVDSDDNFASFVSTSHDETAVLWKWNHQKNKLVSQIICKGHSRSVDTVDVDLEHGRFATGGFDNMVKIWSTTTDETELDVKKVGEVKKAKNEVESFTRTPLVTLASHTESITGIQFTDDKGMVTVSMDNTIKVWDIDIGGFTNNLMGSKSFLDVSYSKLNKLIVTASTDRHVRLWDPRCADGTIVKSNFTSHTAWVSAVCWSKTIDNQFISSGFDGILKLWDVRSPKAPLYDMEGHEDKLLCCDWSLPEYMVSGSVDNKLKIFRHTDPHKEVESM